MNRIILIGNGFDLAHGLETSYHHFIDNYWGKVASCLKHSEEGIYSDSFFDIYYDDRQQINDIDSEKKDNIFFDIDIKKTPFENIKERLLSNDINYTFKNRFLEIISNNYSYKKWVDIEKEYYQALKSCLKVENSYNIEKLNEDFENIKHLLQIYLADISRKKIDNILFKRNILDKISTEFRYREFSQLYKNSLIERLIENVNPKYESEKEDETFKAILYTFRNHYQIEDLSNIKRENIEVILNDIPRMPSIIQELKFKNILFLNFNYTNTISVIYHSKEWLKHIEEIKDINIHGKLNNSENPIIFGFGDEIDNDYSRIENFDDKIGSLKILKAPNITKQIIINDFSNI